MYKAIEIADYFIRKGIEDNDPISNMKLQKLLYYAQGWYMTIADGQPLFAEDFKKWSWGPVCPSVYNRFKKLVAEPIRQPFLHVSTIDDRHLQRLLDSIWINYGKKFTAIQLSDLSHDESPWLEAEQFQTISNDSIYRFFKDLSQHGGKKLVGQA